MGCATSKPATIAVALRRGLERSCAAAVAGLRDMARPLDGLAAIGRCADTLCGDDQLALLLGEIFDIVGTSRYVQVDGGYTRGLERQYIEGAYWYEGYLSPYFITDPTRQEARLEQPAILIGDLRLTSAEQLTPLLDRMVQAGLTSLMIIAQEVSGSALGMLVHNHQSGTLRSVAVKPPARRRSAASSAGRSGCADRWAADRRGGRPACGERDTGRPGRCATGLGKRESVWPAWRAG